MPIRSPQGCQFAKQEAGDCLVPSCGTTITYHQETGGLSLHVDADQVVCDFARRHLAHLRRAAPIQDPTS